MEMQSSELCGDFTFPALKREGKRHNPYTCLPGHLDKIHKTLSEIV